jgi:hypothetical protein
MENSFKLTFSNEKTAEAVRVYETAELPETLNKMGLQSPSPTLVIVGGASNISEADFLRLQDLFVQVLAPIVENLGACVVDGGTDAGVMKLIGQAHDQIAATFPLIGVAPDGIVALPNESNPPSNSTPLESNHTHFVLIPGSNWGDESPWIVNVATVLAAEKPSVTVLINGGEITFSDALNSVTARRLVLVVAGSGRTADKIVDAMNGNANDERAQKLADSGFVESINLEDGFDNIGRIIQGLLINQD